MRTDARDRHFHRLATHAAPVTSADIRLTWQPIHRQYRSMTNASFTADVTPPTGPTPPAPTPAPVSAKEEAVDTVRFLALLAIAVLVFRSFFLSPFNIPSESMQPRLLIGDSLLVNKMAYGYPKFKIGRGSGRERVCPY